MLKPGGYFFGAAVMRYEKPPISIQQQVELLRERGMAVPDPDRAAHYLTHIGYYRLSAYWLPFERLPELDGQRSHRFNNGVSFDDVLDRYVLDRQLRLLCLEALERIEISVRAAWVNAFALRYGPHAYLNAELFKCPYAHAVQVAQVAGEMQKSSEVFVDHYRKKYREPGLAPIWVMAETLSFGALSKWIQSTRDTEVQKVVMRQLSLPTVEIMHGVLHNLSQLRNICAHHARLWNRRFPKKYPYIIKMPDLVQPEADEDEARSIRNHLVMLRHLMVVINPHSSWPQRLCEFLSRQCAETLRAMRLPPNWVEILGPTSSGRIQP